MVAACQLTPEAGFKLRLRSPKPLTGTRNLNRTGAEHQNLCCPTKEKESKVQSTATSLRSAITVCCGGQRSFHATKHSLRSPAQSTNLSAAAERQAIMDATSTMLLLVSRRVAQPLWVMYKTNGRLQHRRQPLDLSFIVCVFNTARTTSPVCIARLSVNA